MDSHQLCELLSGRMGMQNKTSHTPSVSFHSSKKAHILRNQNSHIQIRASVRIYELWRVALLYAKAHPSRSNNCRPKNNLQLAPKQLSRRSGCSGHSTSRSIEGCFPHLRAILVLRRECGNEPKRPLKENHQLDGL